MTRAVLLLLLATLPFAGAAQGPASPPQGPTLRASVDQVVVDVVVTDATGRPALRLTAADFEIIERGRPQTITTFTEVSLPLVRREVALPSAGDVRSNAGGSVMAEADVPAANVGLGISPLALSSRQAGRVPSATRDAALEAALGGRPPTTVRAFESADTLSAYAELIDGGAKTVRAVTVSTVVRTAGGKELVRSPQPNANQGVAAGRSFAYVIDLPLESLAPGRYTLRVEARAEGADAVVARETAFDVRSAAP